MAYNAENEKIIELGALEKSRRGDEIKVRLISKSTSDAIDIRNWYTDNDDEMKPTQKGVRINAEQAGELIKMLVVGYVKLYSVQADELLDELKETVEAELDKDEDADEADEN